MLAHDLSRPAGTAFYHRPRGSWRLNKSYTPSPAGATRLPLISDTTIYVQFPMAEPLLMSPSVFGSGYGKQGFCGAQTMWFQMNMSPTASRAWSFVQSLISDKRKSVSVASYEDSQLIVRFLTPHGSGRA